MRRTTAAAHECLTKPATEIIFASFGRKKRVIVWYKLDGPTARRRDDDSFIQISCTWCFLASLYDKRWYVPLKAKTIDICYSLSIFEYRSKCNDLQCKYNKMIRLRLRMWKRTESFFYFLAWWNMHRSVYHNYICVFEVNFLLNSHNTDLVTFYTVYFHFNRNSYEKFS